LEKGDMLMSKKKMLTLILGVVMALSVFVAAPATSHASATGYAYWGAFKVSIGGQTISIPSGQLTHIISGSGYHIDWDGANFGSAANICDPSMRFTYGNGAYRMDGNVHWGCSRGGQWKYTLNWDAPRGDACAELWAKNWQIRVARQCHYIYG
jgi:hypothetical protein